MQNGELALRINDQEIILPYRIVAEKDNQIQIEITNIQIVKNAELGYKSVGGVLVANSFSYRRNEIKQLIWIDRDDLEMFLTKH